MAYTTINKSTDYFSTVIYTGTNAVKNVTGVGHQPDLVWIKDRSGTNSGSHNHNLIDSVRAAPKIIMSDSTAAEITDSTDALTAFASDGFTLGANNTGTQSQELNGHTNGGNEYVSWNWKAGTTSGITTNGSTTITPTAYSFNQTAGFSIIKYNGSGSNAKIPHGLGVAPKVVIVKQLNVGTEHWGFYHASRGNTKTLYLNKTDDEYGATNMWYDTSPDTVNFSVGTNDIVNNNSADYIAYCFAEKTGYSKFGEYTGNGNGNDGSFIYTGFAPHWLMVKRTDANGNSWRIYSTNDDLSHGANGRTKLIHANLTNAEDSAGDALDLLSNGFKHVTSSTDQNADGANYIYMAFGQSLVGSNNIPCTAR